MSVRRLASGLVALLIAAVLVLTTRQLGGTDDYRSTPLLGELAPDVELIDLDGERFDFTDLRGRSVIVNFWNTWCAPCIREIPALETFWSRHSRDGDVEFVGIVRDDNHDSVRGFIDDRRWDWTVAFDDQGRAALGFGTIGQPETFAIAPDGLVVGRRVGEASVADLEQLLAMARGQT